MSRLNEIVELAGWLLREVRCSIDPCGLAVLGGDYVLTNPRAALWYLHRDDLRIIHRSLQSLQKERAEGSGRET